MNVTQVMVGDLVKYFNSDDNNEHVCEVDTVFSDGRVLLFEDDSEDDDDEIDTFAYKLEPIQITRHFLKINGFEPVDPDSMLWSKRDGEYGISYGFHDLTPDATITFYDEVNKKYVCPECKYVHELQHLMRMAKLDEFAAPSEIKIK